MRFQPNSCDKLITLRSAKNHPMVFVVGASCLPKDREFPQLIETATKINCYAALPLMTRKALYRPVRFSRFKSVRKLYFAVTFMNCIMNNFVDYRCIISAVYD